MRNWIAQGVDQRTGGNTSIIVQAETEEEAADEARKKGLLVLSLRETNIDPAAVDQPVAAPQLSDSEALRQIAERLEEISKCIGPIRFWVTLMGILMLLSLIFSILVVLR